MSEKKIFQSDKDRNMGAHLSKAINRDLKGDCLSIEEIAELVDGSIDKKQRDLRMAHLASCDTCYETYLLASEITDRNEIIVRKTDYYKPLTIAASVLVAVFSLFLYYKVILSPDSKEAVSPMMYLTESPKESFSENNKTRLKTEYKEPEKEEADADEHRMEERPASPVSGAEKEKNKKRRQAWEKTPGKKNRGVVLRKEEPLSAPVEKAASEKARIMVKKDHKGMKKGQTLQAVAPVAEIKKKVASKSKIKGGKQDIGFDDGTSKKATHQQRTKDFQYFQQQTKVTQKQNFEEKQSLQVYGGVEAQKREGRLREVTLPEARQEIPVWEKARILKDKIMEITPFIKAEELNALFKASINLSNAMNQGRSGRIPPTREISRISPVFRVATLENKDIFLPNVDIFLSKSQPGTMEHKFFTLATQGWSPAQGFYFKSKKYISRSGLGKSIVDNISDKKSPPKEPFLDEWKSLKPSLKGIFQKIAENTIHHLEKKQKQKLKK
jgi:hypothetical protein